MTKLLQRVIAELEKLSEEEQDAIRAVRTRFANATRLLAELEDERGWKVRFAATTDDGWNRLAQMVRQEIAAGDITPIADVSEHIEITPGVCGGKPRIAGHRIKVAAIAEMYLEMGESLEEIASKYNLSLASVHAAMAYYYDHKQEIDRQTAEGEAFVEELKRNSPSSR